MVLSQKTRLQTLCVSLSVVFLCMLAHTLKLSHDRCLLMETFRAKFDSDGDHRLSKQEVAKWAVKTFGNIGEDPVAANESLNKFTNLVSQFDANEDSNFSDEEMYKLFDMFDEMPNASSDIKALGGDKYEVEFLVTVFIASIGICSIFLLYHEAFSTARVVSSLNSNLQQQKKEFYSIQNEMISLQKEAKELEASLGLRKNAKKDKDHQNVLNSIDENTAIQLPTQEQLTSQAEKEENENYKLNRSISAVATAAAAKWRLVEVKKSLARKAIEVKDVKAQAKAMALSMEEKLNEFSFQSERLKLMQQCLSLGHNKYSAEGACFGFAIQQGSIFGSLSDQSPDMWRVVRELGTGKRGAFMVRSLATEQEKAMKRYDLLDSDTSVKSELVTELRTNASIGRGHPNIVQYEQIIETERYVFVLMELVGQSRKCRGMDLFDFITVEKRNKVIQEDEVKVIFKQLLHALQYLHHNQVIHGDIKPENVMLEIPKNPAEGSGASVVKLIDFGCACFLKHATGEERNIWDSYSPPEVFSGGLGMGVSMDMYRLGATLYTTLQACPPSQSISNDKRRQGVFNTSYRWKSLSPNCRDLITSLLSFHPEDRLNCEQVLLHPWFEEEGAPVPLTTSSSSSSSSKLHSMNVPIPQGASQDDAESITNATTLPFVNDATVEETTRTVKSDELTTTQSTSTTKASSLQTSSHTLPPASSSSTRQTSPQTSTTTLNVTYKRKLPISLQENDFARKKQFEE